MLHGVAASLPNMKKVRAHQIPIDLTNDYKAIRPRLTQAEPKGRVKTAARFDDARRREIGPKEAAPTSSSVTQA
jgi:hypothetical protein